ncbi:MarR family winged helix-turn-helix transcriptional regulator [Paracoccus sp. (in: a-proteobacteria)]|uniref:MarR family winged helix-turn-helix transcriptional regulator n=1 Tax=Paracoccus sp. TaxID=267 RepID=UPI003A8429B7
MTATDQTSGGRQRLSSPVKDRGGHTVIDIRNYAPFLINVVSNAWQRRTSSIYRERFGLGITEWRVMSMLNIEPDITAHRVCAVVTMDKAAASRSLKTLLDGGYVTFDASPTDPRKRKWRLSGKGLQTHDEILAIALGCEAEMLEGVPPGDLETFLRVMRHLDKNLGASAV